MRWFLPAGVERPAHLPPLELTGEVGVIAGPDGGPGRMVGGVYLPDEAGWVQVGPYWINAADSNPSRLLRLDARDGIELPGSDPTHRWLIPTLLRPAAGGLVWDGVERLGPTGWVVPPPPEPYRSLGLRVAQPTVSGAWEQLGEAGVTALALDLYCANYHLVAAELVAAQWLTRAMVPAVLPAVIRLPEA